MDAVKQIPGEYMYKAIQKYHRQINKKYSLVRNTEL